jgi:CRP/FNR family transcriptional regulator, cyclic AMP receptor protein
MKRTQKLSIGPKSLFTGVGADQQREYQKKHDFFAQGDQADAILFIESGRVKLTVISAQGKEAVVGVLDSGEFFGEGCLGGQQLRMVTATALTDCTVVRVEKSAAIQAIQENRGFAETFVAHLLSRNIRIEADLVDQLFNSSEKRLARVLLLLAHFGKDGTPDSVIPKVSQETLAEMIGTTRSRVSYFMNRFRKLGFIKYNGELEVHSSLLNFVLHDLSKKRRNQARSLPADQMSKCEQYCTVRVFTAQESGPRLSRRCGSATEVPIICRPKLSLLYQRENF